MGCLSFFESVVASAGFECNVDSVVSRDSLECWRAIGVPSLPPSIRGRERLTRKSARLQRPRLHRERACGPRVPVFRVVVVRDERSRREWARVAQSPLCDFVIGSQFCLVGVLAGRNESRTCCPAGFAFRLALKSSSPVLRRFRLQRHGARRRRSSPTRT